MGGSFGESILIYLLFVWSLIWKGLALWRAANQAQRNWFIVLLILNTVGILDIIYLFRFSKKRMNINEVKTGIQSIFLNKPKTK